MLSIIVPCYNEQEVIRETNRRIFETFRNADYEIEVIYINDGSRDNTLDILYDLSSNNDAVKVINLSRNFGHQPAVTAGLNNCKGDYVVIIDADLQDPPECIPEMLSMAINEGIDVVYGKRTDRAKETFTKKLFAKFYYRFLNFFSEYKIPTDTGDFRLVSRKVVNDFNALSEKQKYIRGLFAWLGYKQAPYYYKREGRFAGETNYPFIKSFILGMRGLMYFSRKPLNLSLMIGIFFVALSIIGVIYLLISKLVNPESTILGWTSIIIAICFFGGVQLFTLGIIGVYIGNIFEEVKRRPEYIINHKE